MLLAFFPTRRSSDLEPALSLQSARAARWEAAERLWLPADEGVATVHAMRSPRPPRQPRAERQRRAQARKRVRRLAEIGRAHVGTPVTDQYRMPSPE